MWYIYKLCFVSVMNTLQPANHCCYYTLYSQKSFDFDAGTYPSLQTFVLTLTLLIRATKRRALGKMRKKTHKNAQTNTSSTYEPRQKSSRIFYNYNETFRSSKPNKILERGAKTAADSKLYEIVNERLCSDFLGSSNAAPRFYTGPFNYKSPAWFGVLTSLMAESIGSQDRAGLRNN